MSTIPWILWHFVTLTMGDFNIHFEALNNCSLRRIHDRNIQQYSVSVSLSNLHTNMAIFQILFFTDTVNVSFAPLTWPWTYIQPHCHCCRGGGGFSLWSQLIGGGGGRILSLVTTDWGWGGGGDSLSGHNWLGLGGEGENSLSCHNWLGLGGGGFSLWSQLIVGGGEGGFSLWSQLTGGGGSGARQWESWVSERRVHAWGLFGTRHVTAKQCYMYTTWWWIFK